MKKRTSLAYGLITPSLDDGILLGEMTRLGLNFACFDWRRDHL